MEKETQDLMNVESFSQLPFIRPSVPLKEKSIRLFGKEFVGAAATDSSTIILTDECDSTVTPVTEHSKDTGESHRKFKCHYCCRNFPTSQALGGHQNAHKRERQHAKRAHLQSTMFQGSFNYTAAQMYNVMNYHHRLATQIPPYHHQQQPPPPSWGTIYNNAYRSHQTVPINGSPLATWSFSTARISDGLKKPSRSETAGDNSMQIRYPYEQKSSVADQVSLDLSL